jgi:hypothetical protein
MFAKTGIPDAENDGSGDSDSEFLGSHANWIENDRTLRRHTPKATKKEKHQRDKTMGVPPSKKVKSDPIEIDDFDFGDRDVNEDVRSGYT